MNIKNCKYINKVDVDGNKIPDDPICIKTTLEDDKILEVPLDPDNTDYQEYLEWVAEGNTPEPADE
jgi:hypothetical protein